MPVNIIGPHGAGINETTTRPTDTSSGSSSDTWFTPCVNGDPNTGTKVPANWLNKVTAQLRRAIRGMGVTENELDDDMLLKAIQNSQTGLWITTDTTITVAPSGAQYTTIQAALDSLDQKLIKPGVTVTISVAAGTYVITSPILVRHVHAAQIHIVGAALVGSWPPAANATQATEETTVRTALPTIIYNNGCIGLWVQSTRLGLLKNICFTGDDSNIGILIGRTLLTGPLPDGETYGPASIGLDTVAVIGQSTGIVAQSGADVIGYRVLADHSAAVGIQINNNSHAVIDAPAVRYNGSHGVWCYDMSGIEMDTVAITNNSGAGILAGDNSLAIAQDGSCIANTSHQLFALDGAQIIASVVNLLQTGGTGSAFANQGSHIRLSSCTNIGTCSPAVNTIGNNNSYIASA